MQQAVDVRRILAMERPAAFNPDLATSLDALARYRSAVGHQGEALDAIQEGADEIRRKLGDGTSFSLIAVVHQETFSTFYLTLASKRKFVMEFKRQTSLYLHNCIPIYVI